MGIRTAFDPLGTTGNQRGLPFTFTIDTTKNTANTLDNTFIIPFTAGTYTSLSGVNVGISWGDGKVTIIGNGIFNQENCTHEYTKPGIYQISITSENDTAPKFNFYHNYNNVNGNNLKLISTQSGIIPQIDTNGNLILNNTFAYTFQACSNLKTITTDLFKNSPNITAHAFRLTFEKCTSLTSIPANLFRYNTQVNSNAFYMTFLTCTNLTSIPANLFRYNTQVSDKSFYGTFQDCTGLTSVPDNLFLYNTQVSTEGFNNTFEGCINLISIPNNLFYTNTLATGFIHTFYNCPKLTINPYIFGNYDIDPSIKTTRFNRDSTYYFTEMFYRDEFKGMPGASGTPGDYWAWTFKQTPVGTNCYGGLGNTSIVDYNNIPENWGGPVRYRLTVNAIPSDASILLETLGGLYTQIDNYIKVLYGTQVRYTVSRQWYNTVSDVITVTEDTTLNITLDPILHTFTINALPVSAVVSLTAPGYLQQGNSISVPYNTTVNWSVTNPHYTTQSGTQLIGADDITTDITLIPENYTITITPTPSDATVLINDIQRKTATFVYNTLVNWSVSKTGYITQTASFNINQNTNLDITLDYVYYTITINPTPADATVIINGVERKTARLKEGTEVTYSISKDRYESIEDTFILTLDLTLDVELEPLFRLTINPIPSDAIVTLTAEQGEQKDNYIDVPGNDPITWSVSKEDYTTQSGVITLTEDTAWNITLKRTTYKFEIVPTPSDAAVTMICSDPDYVQEQSQNYILAPTNTTVSWTVERVGYDTATGTQAIGRESIILPVVLVGQTYVKVSEYEYTETSSGVTITKYIGSGTEIVAPHLEVES